MELMLSTEMIPRNKAGLSTISTQYDSLTNPNSDFTYINKPGFQIPNV